MKLALVCNGLTVKQVAVFFEREAGKKISTPGKGWVKIPRMKTLKRSDEILVMSHWHLRFIAEKIQNGTRIVSEIRLFPAFWACLIGGFILPPLLGVALGMFISRCSITPQRVEMFNQTVAEGAKGIKV